MEQTNIIQQATQQFADKFRKLGEVRIQDHYENGKKEGQSLIEVTFLCIEEIVTKNMMERVKCREKVENDEVIEFFISTPSMFKLTYMVTPYYKTFTDTMKIMGEIVQILKDDNTIPVEKYDWVDNDRQPIMILPVPDMDMKSQMEVFDFLKADYRPSLFYHLLVGIDSQKKEIFKRVKERQVTVDYLDKVRERAERKADEAKPGS